MLKFEIEYTKITKHVCKEKIDSHCLKTANIYAQNMVHVLDKEDWSSPVETNKSFEVTPIEELEPEPCKSRLLKKLYDSQQIITLEDGCRYLWTDQGAISAHELRLIAEELEKFNEEIYANYEKNEKTNSDS